MKFLRRFSSNERDAVIVLVLVIIVSVVLFPLLSEQNDGGQEVEVFKGLRSSRNTSPPNREGAGEGCLLSNFDPNTASESQLLSLGLSERQVRNIMKYRSCGGRFRKKEDFARLYGLTLEKYRQLEPYITIQPEVMAADVIKPAPASQGNLGASRVSARSDSSRLTIHSSQNKLRYGETVDINTADTALLKRIPGIGSYFAMRIVELRKRRQVLSSPEELLTIRDFPETALTYMTASQNFPVIYVNLWSQKELAAHPLLNYAQARDVIALRRVSGVIEAASDLAALPSFDAKTMENITPLLRFDTVKK